MAAEPFTKVEKAKLQTILNDTVNLLIRNALTGKFSISYAVNCVLGIFIDDEDASIVCINEKMKNPKVVAECDHENASDAGASSHRKKGKKRKRQNGDGGSDAKYQRQQQQGMQDDYGYEGYNPHDIKQEMDQSYASGGAPGQYYTQNNPMDPNINMTQQMPPVVPMGDLDADVELMEGTGVYIKRATYNQLQFIDKGSKLVRKLVREIFPDVNLLASSSCMGKGESSAGLDRHKVEVIKGASQAATTNDNNDQSATTQDSNENKQQIDVAQLPKQVPESTTDNNNNDFKQEVEPTGHEGSNGVVNGHDQNDDSKPPIMDEKPADASDGTANSGTSTPTSGKRKKSKSKKA